MTTFTVDTDTIKAAATSLERIRTDLHSLAKLPASDRDALGGVEVFTWLDHFSSEWNYGADQIDASVSTLVTNLTQAAQNYHHGEATITKGFDHGGGAGGGSGGGSGSGGKGSGGGGSGGKGSGGGKPGHHTAPAPSGGPTAAQKTKIDEMTNKANSLLGVPYVSGGGHAAFGPTDGGLDCSGFVSAVLHAAGYLSAPQTTDTLPGQPGIESGPGKYVTIFDRTDGSYDLHHVIIEINGQFYECGGMHGYWGGGGGVEKIGRPSASYMSEFNTILHPEGL